MVRSRVDGRSKISKSALTGLLPTAAEVGPDYRVEESGEESEEESATAETDEAMRNSCPEAAAIFAKNSGESNKDRVERNFITEDGRQFSVGPEPSGGSKIDVDALDEIVDAINGCDTITLSEDGMDFTMELSAEMTDDLGDVGMLMRMELELTATDDPSDSLEFEAQMSFFSVDGVNVLLMAMSSLDDVMFTPIPGDFDLRDSVGKLLVTKVAKLEC